MFQADIIKKCQSNDRNAQLQLYNKYCDGMLVVAKRFITNTMEAEDVVQESFIKAFTKLHQYKAEVTFGAWLKRIVINKSIDALKLKKQSLKEIDEAQLMVVDEATEDWNIEVSVTIEDVKIAINQLPSKYKYVVLLYLVEGYDHQEISEILGISQIASRTQLSRGKIKLKNLLKKKKNGTES